MTTIFDKWDSEFDVAGLQKDIAEAEANGGNHQYKEVPVGTYEVKIEKMELKQSKAGKPLFAVQFKILTGEYTNSCLFMNQVVVQGFQFGIVNDFLRSLDTGIDVDFVSFGQYSNLIMDVMEAVDGKLEFLLDYTQSSKGYSSYKIKEVYEV